MSMGVLKWMVPRNEGWLLALLCLDLRIYHDELDSQPCLEATKSGMIQILSALRIFPYFLKSSKTILTMKYSTLLVLLMGAAGISALSNPSSPNCCNSGFYPGADTVTFTVPYTYAQVMSIIGHYQNFTSSSSPAGSVTLNGIDNRVRTAKTYEVGRSTRC
ncbi:hypothetical protein F5882DRAFT_460844 [Hyaloscypha sp. PMI_1271]|nr:hypothetical protein F5882DRAFT_460844 [Hyaloscypha sp. PMI_1271]